MASEAYEETMKRRVVERFVAANDRSPTIAELRDLMITERATYHNIDEVGISGVDVSTPQFKDRSSIAIENKNRKALFDDLKTIMNRVDDLTTKLEDSFRGFQGSVGRTMRLLKKSEARIDNLLLLNSSADAFVYGIEETFDSQEYIDFTNTDASVESGWVTLGRTGYKVVDLDSTRIIATAVAERNLLSSTTNSPIEYLKEEDGSFWEHLVYTDTRIGRVSLILDVELDDPTYVGDLRVTGNPISTNVAAAVTIFYSVDGQTYTPIEPVEREFRAGETQFNVGVDNVKRLRLLFSKNVSDTQDSVGRYLYIFSIDSLKIFTDAYTDSKESTLIAGPYSVVDEEGTAVYFTKATIETCSIVPEQTGVAWSLSKDGSTWLSVDETESLGIVTFASSSSTGTGSLADATLDANAVLDGVGVVDDLEFTRECLLNTYIGSAYANIIPIRSIVVKRNIIDSSSLDEIFRVAPGWYLDGAGYYTTTVYIKDPEGRYLELGGTGALVNGSLVSGRVHLKQGYSVFSTSDANWLDVTDSLTTLDELKTADPLYPYNHKLLVEGYRYGTGFTGEQIYTGVYEYFGRKLDYVAPEKFNSSVYDGDLGIYTLEDVGGDLYFKVKTDKTDSSWVNEKYNFDWLVQSDSTNTLYVRAILSTENTNLTPAIDHFKVRVV